MIALAALSACGGGSTKTSGPQLPRPAYVAKANAICAQTNQRIKNGAATAFTDPNQAASQDPALVQTFASTVVLPALQSEYSQLTALRPTSDTNPHATLSALEDATDKWEADKALIASLGDTSFAQFDRMATDFGMTTCATTDMVVRSIAGGSQAAT
ncbi:MAG TPA: hypothetical protein VHT75_15525 [Acidimicrobiales bacterium]|nr:hypothetical protein [Acidimicrobiales bacterium]